VANKTLAKKIYRKQNEIVREVNNAHIFLEQIGPLLNEVREKYAKSKGKKDKRYYVPSGKRFKFARRNDKELKDIYNRYIERGLFEVFLVDLIARFEWFLSDVFVEFFSHYPKRMLEKFQGIPPVEKIDFTLVIEADGKDDLIKKLISNYISGVLRQRPHLYISYATILFDMERVDIFDDYYEMCATRDLIVHGSGIVNEIYLSKAGSKARGHAGARVVVDDEYFSHCVATLKSVSGKIKGAFESKFGGGSNASAGQ
jgi:hypothetical protein